MKTITQLLGLLILAGTLLATATSAQAASERDCLLEGTVQKSAGNETDPAKVRFHSVSRYDEDSNCRMRDKGKMEFKLPADPRVQQAPAGSSVKYRYRTEADGSTQTELISVGT